METCFEQRCQLLIETYCLLNIYNTHYLVLRSEMMGKSMPLTMQNFPRSSFKFEGLLIGYKSKFKDRLAITIMSHVIKILWNKHLRNKDHLHLKKNL